jgi:adenylate kinase
METKNRNIIFIGGIHGVGKGTICKKISVSKKITHLSASKVLKWNEISTKENKLVNSLDETQSRLIKGLDALIQNTNTYLLDGHYCLLNSKNKPEKVPEKTFEIIDPIVMAIVIEGTEVIYERLKQRDGTKYSLSLLDEMQEMEIGYAKYLSSKFNKPYVEIHKSNYGNLNKYLP